MKPTEKNGIKKILVVEDEKSLNQILQRALTNAGFEASAAYNGEDALDNLSKNKFDLVLLDLLLPKINGFDVMIEMSKRHDTTPVIVISNLSREESKKEAMDLGAESYLVKNETTIANIIQLIKDF